jgi:alanyl-tRNA synthetase
VRVVIITDEGLTVPSGGDAATVFMIALHFMRVSGGVGIPFRGEGFEFEVRDTLKSTGFFFGHVNYSSPDASRRNSRRRYRNVTGGKPLLHHSATHLLRGLKRLLGDRGARGLVAPDHFRFDFTTAGVSAESREIERLVNGNSCKPGVHVEVMDLKVHKTGAQPCLARSMATGSA